jgi:hypothetical protein
MEDDMICVSCGKPIAEGEAFYIGELGSKENRKGPFQSTCVFLSGLITREDAQPLSPEDVRGRK